MALVGKSAFAALVGGGYAQGLHLAVEVGAF